MSRSAERKAMAAPRRGRHNRLVGPNAFWHDLARDLDDPEFRRAYVSSVADIAATDLAIHAKALASGEEVSGRDQPSS